MRLITVREFWFIVHLGFGVVWIHAFAGGIAGLLKKETGQLTQALRASSTVAMSVVAWLAVVTGTWLVYPGYRAEPPEGVSDLTGYPRSALLADSDLSVWHTFGMEWKEHVGWLTPFLATAVAFVVLRYGRLVAHDQQVRRGLSRLFLVASGAALVAAALGGLINAVAPNEFLDVPSVMGENK